MKTLKKLFAVSLVGPSLLHSAVAQNFPVKPIKLVIGFPAGGPLDQHARLLTDKLSAVLGQPIIVDYKAGAGGIVGAHCHAALGAFGQPEYQGQPWQNQLWLSRQWWH